MKKILVAISICTIAGCSASRQYQAEFTNARLIKIDTVFRYGTDKSNAWQREQALTWMDEDKNTFVSYASLQQSFQVGTRITMLRKR